MAETHCRMSSAFADLSLLQPVRKHVLYKDTPVLGDDYVPPFDLTWELPIRSIAHETSVINSMQEIVCIEDDLLGGIDQGEGGRHFLCG